MQQRPSEREGCLVLKREFENAGLRILERHEIEAGGLRVELDGYDPERRVGYEFVTSAGGDRASLSPEVLAALESRMEAGDLHVLLVDEWEVVSGEELAGFARRFLAELKARGGLP
ncbi:hypothetical protein FBQ97_06515 [Acidobacteria bacterium ACD]|nr:MAG: hypothetical protein EDX89_10950 [Acidobacteriota bacterium]MCE7958659.1 hypothetical protein [Acidobacteria bacterium ACB2]MDL1949450.1 hypothetical protein [Acidobacteria bacterium ACD]